MSLHLHANFILLFYSTATLLVDIFYSIGFQATP